MERIRFFNKLKKPLHILTAFAVILCTAFAFPIISFADTNQILEFPADKTYVGYRINNTSVNVYYSSNDTFYGYFVARSSTEDPTFFVASPISVTVSMSIFYDNTLFVTDTYNINTLDQNSNLYYANTIRPIDDTSNVFETFTTYQDGLLAVADYIENGGGNSTVYDFETTVEVPSGSVAYIGIPSSGSLSISAKTEMPMYTSIGSNTWSNVPQRVKQVSSLPDSTTTFPLAGSAIPNWTKTEPYNWLNQSKSAVTSTTSWSGSNGNFLTFYNPVYYMDGSIQASTNTVYLTISGYSSIRIYPLQNDMSITAGSTSTSPTDYDGYWDATITDNGDGTGSVSYNPSEGSNLPPTPTSNQYNTGTSSSIIDYINQINQTLTNFAESFINLLKAPVAHIQQLVSAGSDFVSQLSGLYSWLPAEVYNTLTSAIILCISVGVLKVLL